MKKILCLALAAIFITLALCPYGVVLNSNNLNFDNNDFANNIVIQKHINLWLKQMINSNYSFLSFAQLIKAAIPILEYHLQKEIKEKYYITTHNKIEGE